MRLIPNSPRDRRSAFRYRRQIADSAEPFARRRPSGAPGQSLVMPDGSAPLDAVAVDQSRRPGVRHHLNWRKTTTNLQLSCACVNC
jgi:hypothetical protein